MNLNLDTAADSGALRLRGALDIYGAEKLREALLTRFGDTNEIVLDLGAVETCDTAGVQLLLAARRKAAGGARVLRFVNVPGVIRTCCQRLGLAQEF